MKKIFVFIILAFCMQQSFAQFTISYVPIVSYSKTQIDSMYTANSLPVFLLPIRYDVTVYKVLYNTVSYDSTATIASGALIVPNNPLCKMPLVTYQHGTILAKEDAPSRNTGEIIIGIALAADGYAVSMPDYLGLGDSPIALHPYVHAHSEATAAVDMMRASREIITGNLGDELNDQLFLVGYSQGGHATMALQKLIEEQLSSEFHITFSAPMSGPYDLSGTQANVITNDSVFSQPAFLPYVIFSMNEVYHLFVNPGDVFASPYDVLLPPLFDGTHGTGDVNAVMPAIPNQVLRPEVLDSFRTDPNHYFRVALRDNDLINWAPSSPTTVYYCEADEQVYYQNALVALNSFIQHGSTSVHAESAGLTLNHGGCARIALILGKFDFEALRNDIIHTTFTVTDESMPGANDGGVQMTVSGGIPPYSFLWSNAASTQNISNLGTGWYYLALTDSNACVRYDSVYVDLTSSVHNLAAFENQVKLFPNPASETTIVSFGNLKFSALTMELYDITGKKITIKNFTTAQKTIFNCSQFSNGIYFLKFIFDGKPAVYKKLVIGKE